MNQARSVASLLIGFLVFGLVLWIARTVHQELNDEGFAQTVLIGIGGWALGWLVGFLISPSTGQEIKKFSQAASTIGAFVSGFALAKLEPSLTPLFENGRLINEPIYGIRLLIFMICFAIAAINMYIYREGRRY
ncbi:MAG: hypothetical protein DCF25_20130 [Leptolyngbya foveolarum]|uniref:Uncharacterized protein n=1 Tax=Leptolyngbya foveolarum TaxID=47253 RepID=A0A2W4TWJ6_9CYAN|nr:MAG: hypothetical protein DCF25_20130 [Leptolyngbya foveolarum]